MRAALDTNLLVYAEGLGDDDRVNTTRRLLDQLSDANLVIPRPAVRLCRPRGRCSEVGTFPVLKTFAAAWRGAMDLCMAHQSVDRAAGSAVAPACGMNNMVNRNAHSHRHPAHNLLQYSGEVPYDGGDLTGAENGQRLQCGPAQPH